MQKKVFWAISLFTVIGLSILARQALYHATARECFAIPSKSAPTAAPNYEKPAAAKPQPTNESKVSTATPNYGNPAAIKPQLAHKPQTPHANAALLRLDGILYKDAEVVAKTETPPAADGTFQRTEIVKLTQPFKYPLARLEETVAAAQENNRPQNGAVQRRAHAPSGHRHEMVADHIIVKFKPGAKEEDLVALVTKNTHKIRRKLRAPGLYLVQIPAQDTEALPRAIANYKKETGTVAYAEPDYIVHTLDTTPSDPGFSNQWGMKNTGQNGGTAGCDIKATYAWSLSTGSKSVKVAVIDTGIDYTHPDLAANVDYADGYNFVSETSNAMDDFFHGTHCAGIIGAVGNNGVGVAGVCWQVTLIPLKFLDSTGSGTTSDAVQAVTYATTTVPVNIMSNSWGGGDFSQSLQDAIDAANTAGILFVAAAGNDGSDNDLAPTYPASYSSSNIIAVAATDSNDLLASFSNDGPASVHLGAPGVHIYSTLPGVKSTQIGTPRSTS